MCPILNKDSELIGIHIADKSFFSSFVVADSDLKNEWELFNSKHSAELTEIVKNGEQQLDILADKIEKIKLEKRFFQL